MLRTKTWLQNSSTLLSKMITTHWKGKPCLNSTHGSFCLPIAWHFFSAHGLWFIQATKVCQKWCNFQNYHHVLKSKDLGCILTFGSCCPPFLEVISPSVRTSGLVTVSLITLSSPLRWMDRGVLCKVYFRRLALHWWWQSLLLNVSHRK